MKKSTYLILGLMLALFSCGSGDDPVTDVPDPGNPGTPPGSGGGSGGASGKVTVIIDEFQGRNIVLAGSETDNFIVSFLQKYEGEELALSAVQNELPVIMEDDKGNKWDIFGFAVEGPEVGKRLTPTQGLMGYWFSFATFYPGIELYPGLSKGPHEGKSIEGSNGWLVPSNEVRGGGPGKDGIPAVNNPKFDNISNINFLQNDDLVVAFRNGNTVKAYPHDILDWHEIVNDSFDDLHVSIVYCPLTGTGTVWDRTVNGKTTTFGVSGLLYNTNIIPYDRESDSNWSQLFDRSIQGTNSGLKAVNYMPLETNWRTLKKLYPEAQVMNTNTGHSRNYGSYPYGDYKTSSSLIFPIKYTDDRLDPKDRVHVVIMNEKARAYKFSSFR